MRLISYYSEVINEDALPNGYKQPVQYEKLKVCHTAFGIPIWRSTYYKKGNSQWMTSSAGSPIFTLNSTLDNIREIGNIKKKLQIHEIAYRKLTAKPESKADQHLRAIGGQASNYLTTPSTEPLLFRNHY